MMPVDPASTGLNEQPDSHLEAQLLSAIMWVSALIAAFAGERPTGNLLADIALSALFGALVVYFGHRARFRAIEIAGGLALLGAAVTGSAIAAVIAVFAIAISITAGREHKSEKFAAKREQDLLADQAFAEALPDDSELSKLNPRLAARIAARENSPLKQGLINGTIKSGSAMRNSAAEKLGLPDGTASLKADSNEPAKPESDLVDPATTEPLAAKSTTVTSTAGSDSKPSTSATDPATNAAPSSANQDGDVSLANILNSIATLLIAQSVLHFQSRWFVAVPSLLAAVALAPVFLLGFKKLGSMSKKRFVIAAVFVLIYAAASTALASFVALKHRPAVENGIALAEAGVKSVEQGDLTTAEQQLQDSADTLEASRTALTGPLTWPVRIVPIAAQQFRAVDTAVTQGHALAATAKRVTVAADLDRIRGSEGSIDIAVISEVNQELELANTSLLTARGRLAKVDSPWLVPQLKDPIETVQQKLVESADDIQLARMGTKALPTILGSDGPRRYLVLFTQPAEMREFGGFVASYGFLETNQGDFELVESGRILDIFADEAFETGQRVVPLPNPQDFPPSYVQTMPNRFPQNLTSTASLTMISRMAAEMVPLWRDNPQATIDGVIVMDTFAIGALIELTGPVQLSDGHTFDSESAVEYIFKDQYLEYDLDDRASQTDRRNRLVELSAAVFDQLLQIDIPGPERLGEIFGPLARSNSLSFATFNDHENAFLDAIHLSAELPPSTRDSDVLGLFYITSARSKVGAYMNQHLDYKVTFDPETSMATAYGTVTVTNDAPTDLSPYVIGETPEIGGFIVLVHTNGEFLTPLPPDPNAEVQEIQFTSGLGLERALITANTPIQGFSTTEFSTEIEYINNIYNLSIVSAPTPNATTADITITPPEGYLLKGDGVQEDGVFRKQLILNDEYQISLELIAK